jgi:hypothetical protein
LIIVDLHLSHCLYSETLLFSVAEASPRKESAVFKGSDGAVSGIPLSLFGEARKLNRVQRYNLVRLSCGKLRRAFWYNFTDVSEVITASVTRTVVGLRISESSEE